MSLIGSTIGHIRVQALLGAGGMGDVYVGFDETLRRKVAVKAIRRESRIKPDAKSRFLREARVLSQLDHPHICKIFDYIEREESGFLILEFIEGKGLHQVMQEGLDRSTQLGIAEQIAQVLVIAHEKGIVHRDIKPSNVMLTENGEIKILDFGLARFTQTTVEIEDPIAEGQKDVDASEWSRTVDEEASTLGVGPLTDYAESGLSAPPPPSDSLRTKRGKVMGTPMYMSPEQARGEVASAASDMYSFGLLLQELFTGRYPYEDSTDYAGLLQKAMRGETRPVSGLPTDITVLIGRLKSPAPTARPSALETTERLQRIRDKPRRRIRNLAVAALAVGVILGGLKYTFDLRRERGAAIEARDQAEELVDFLIGLFEVSDPGEARGKTITAREILSKGAEGVARELEGQPAAQAKLMETIGNVYIKLGLYDDAEPLLSQALDLRTDSPTADDVAVSDSLQSLAVLNEKQANYEEGEVRARRSLDIREKTLGRDDPLVAETLRILGLFCERQLEYAEAETLYQRALSIRETKLGPDHPDVAESLRDLGVLYYRLDRYDEAEPRFTRALAIREKTLGSDHPDVGGALNSLAALYFVQSRYQEAEPLYRRSLEILETTLGPDHPDVAVCLINIGIIHFYREQFSEAESLYRQALDIRERALGPDHPDVADNLILIADLNAYMGKPTDAEPLYRRALSVTEANEGSDSLALATTQTSLAGLYDDVGRYTEAEVLARRALETREKLLEPDAPDLAESLHNLAHIYHRHLERYAEAEALYRRALAIREKQLTEDDPNLIRTLREYADFLHEHGRSKEAKELETRIPSSDSPTDSHH